MRTIELLIVHHSASMWGNAYSIDQMHKQRNYSQIGYHFVICNGRINNSQEFNPMYDGHIEIGRSLEVVGAHDQGQNSNSVGVCLIGLHLFTLKQLLSLHYLYQGLKASINHNMVIEGHFENEPNSPTACPGDRIRPHMDEFRDWLYTPIPDQQSSVLEKILKRIA